VGIRDAVLDAALKLSIEDGAQIAEKLIESLDPADQEQIEASWVDEVERRMAEEGDAASFVAPADIKAEVDRILKR
jgi:putative addiction module component (TIGR02574 family)